MHFGSSRLMRENITEQLSPCTLYLTPALPCSMTGPWMEFCQRNAPQIQKHVRDRTVGNAALAML
jgi:hypothetical protein